MCVCACVPVCVCVYPHSNAEVEEDGKEISHGIREIDSTIPVAPNTLFLRLIIGDIPIILPNRDDKCVPHTVATHIEAVTVVSRP